MCLIFHSYEGFFITLKLALMAFFGSLLTGQEKGAHVFDSPLRELSFVRNENAVRTYNRNPNQRERIYGYKAADVYIQEQAVSRASILE